VARGGAYIVTEEVNSGPKTRRDKEGKRKHYHYSKDQKVIPEKKKQSNIKGETRYRKAHIMIIVEKKKNIDT